MRSNIPFIRHRADLMRKSKGPACDIVMTWREWTGTPTVDPVTQSKTGSSSVRTQSIRGFVHMVQPTTTAIRRFTEVTVGDAIIEISPDIETDGLEELTFTFGGMKWVRKPVSEGLAATWDAMLGNERIEQTLLLRRAT